MKFAEIVGELACRGDQLFKPNCELCFVLREQKHAILLCVCSAKSDRFVLIDGISSLVHLSDEEIIISSRSGVNMGKTSEVNLSVAHLKISESDVLA